MGKFIRFDINTVNSYGGRLRGGITDQYIEDKASQVADIARALEAAVKAIVENEHDISTAEGKIE